MRITLQELAQRLERSCIVIGDQAEINDLSDCIGRESLPTIREWYLTLSQHQRKGFLFVVSRVCATETFDEIVLKCIVSVKMGEYATELEQAAEKRYIETERRVRELEAELAAKEDELAHWKFLAAAQADRAETNHALYLESVSVGKQDAVDAMKFRQMKALLA